MVTQLRRPAKADALSQAEQSMARFGHSADSG